MKLILFFSLLGILVLNACGPNISTAISKRLPPIHYNEEIKVYGLHDTIPANAEVLGTVKVGDTGFSTNCGWNVVIDQAKQEARKAGGNAIKIIRHRPPNILISSCHRIKALILKTDKNTN